MPGEGREDDKENIGESRTENSKENEKEGREGNKTESSHEQNNTDSGNDGEEGSGGSSFAEAEAAARAYYAGTVFEVVSMELKNRAP